MRIIGGDLKGRRFSGKIPDNVRPTTDATKESIFNILNNYIDFEDIIVADICAGSGALGIEALSRGADSCFFFEKNRKTIHLLEEILEYFGVDDGNYEIFDGDCIKNLISSEYYLKGKIDLALMDPPYETKLCNEIINTLSSKNLLTDGAIIVAEHNQMESINILPCLELLNSKVYGSTVVDFIKFRNQSI